MGFFTDKYGTAGSQPVTSTTTQPSGGGYFTKKYGTPGNPPVATQTELPATTAPLPTSNKSWLQKIGGEKTESVTKCQIFFRICIRNDRLERNRHQD
jgi:hypothetical protein